MQSLRRRIVPLLVLALLFAVARPASAVESHTYQGAGGYNTSFTVAGGQYSLYISAHFARTYATHSPDSCIFVGNLQRVSPTHDTTQFGGAAPVTATGPFNLGPMPVMVPAGKYALFIASQTDCQWAFSLEASARKPVGVDQIQMFKVVDAAVTTRDTTAIGQKVQFSAQYGLGSATTLPSGEMQILHAGQVIVRTPLRVGADPITKAPAVYVAVDWEQSDARYAGSNTVRFTVNVGGAQFTRTKQFTLTP